MRILGLKTSEAEEDLTFIDEAMLAQITKAETCLSDVICSATNLSNTIKSNLLQLNLLEDEWQKIETKAREISDRAPNIIKFDMRGKICKVKKDTLLGAKYSLFHAMISTDIFKPNENGAYFLDIAPDGFERILSSLENKDDYMRGANAFEIHLVRTLNTTAFYSGNALVRSPPNSESQNEGMEDKECSYGDAEFFGTLDSNTISELEALSDNARTARRTACKCLSALKKKIVLLQGRISHWDLLLEQLNEYDIAAQCDIISLDLKGRVFKTYRETLMRNDGSYFHAMLSSGSWLPDEDGVYFIDRWHYGFGRLLDYLSSGYLLLDGLTARDIECVKENMEYFQLKPPGIYLGHSDTICSIIQLKDGRICSGSIDGEIKVWGKLSSDCEITLSGHKPGYMSVIQLRDGSLCSCSHDGTVKQWNLTQTSFRKSVNTSSKAWMIQELTNDTILVLANNASSIGTLHLFNKNLGVQSYISRTNSFTCFASLTNQTIIAGTNEKEVISYNHQYSNNYQQLATVFRGHTGPIQFLAAIDSVTFCSAAENDSTLRIWNTNSAQPLRSIQCDGITPFIGGQFVRDSIFNFFCKSEGVIKLVNLNAPAGEPKVLNLPIDFDTSPINIIMPLSLPDSICTDYNDNSVRVWSVEN